MKIKWWGHATFTITTSDGFKIITDPYNEELPYKIVDDCADYVTVSHSHFDHNAVNLLPGNPQTIKDVNGVENHVIKINGIESYHDQEKGSERGENIIFKYEFDGMKVAHLGDLGHALNDKQLNFLADVDILLIPVGGYFTIDAEQAYEIVKELNHKLVFPMHYKTEVLNLPIKGVGRFLEHFPKERVKNIKDSEIEITELPEEQMVYVLEYIM